MRKVATRLVLLAFMAVHHPVFADAASAARYYEDGLTRFNRGDTAGSIIQLKNALQEDSGMLAAQVLLARAYFEDGDIGPAEVAFAEAIRRGVDRSEVVVPMARIHLARGNPQTVIDQINPDGLPERVRADVLALRGVAFAALNRHAESAESFERARSLRPDALMPLLEEIPLLIGRGQLDQAQARARRATELQPGNAATWDALARVLHAHGDLAGALEHYGRAIEQQPGFVDPRVTRAGLLLDLGRNDEARADLDYLEQAGIADARAAYLRALLAERAGDRASAQRHLDEVTRLVDMLGRDWIAGREVFLMLGALAHHAQGNLEKARGYLNLITSRFPNNLGARRLMAAILVEAGDFGPARSLLEELVRKQPSDAISLSLLGRVMLAQGRSAQAVEYFNRAIAAGGRDAGMQMGLGMGQLASGETENAIESLEKAYDLRPLDSQIASTLVTLYLRHGKTSEALAFTSRMVDAAPQRADVRNLHGVVLGAAGDPESARAAYERALALDPRLEAARFNLMRIDVAQGRFDDARKTLNAVLETDRNHEAALYELGLLELRAGRTPEAVFALDKALASHPDNLRIALVLVDAHLANANPHKALEVARHAATRHIGNVDVLIVQARALFANGDAKAAAGSLREATRLAEFNTGMLVGIARQQLAAGFLDDAAYTAHKALTGQAHDVPALILSAEIALTQGRVDQARGFVETLFALQPESADAYRLAAELALASGDAAVAETRLAEAFKLAPSAQLLRRQAAVWVRNGKTPQAIKASRAWLAKNPSDREIMNLLAELHMQVEDWPAARQVYAMLVDNGQGSGREFNNLANVLARLGDAGAIDAARKAHALSPTDPLIADTLGWLMVQGGSLDEGLRYLRDARLRAPDNAEIRYHLAYALGALGRLEEAMSELDVALASGQAFEERDKAEALRVRYGNGS